MTRQPISNAYASGGDRNPAANIGIPTGLRSSVLVVDVDVHGANSGFGALDRARSAGLVDAWDWLIRTPSGGLHAYFPAVRGVEQRCWQVARAHIDFRGDGGYVIAPPSWITVDGESRRYEVIAVAQHRPRRLDAARLRRFLDPPRLGPPPRSVPSLGARPDKLAAWVAGRPKGSRNHGLFWAACRMAEVGHGYDATLSVLSDAARVAGLPDRESETTISVGAPDRLPSLPRLWWPTPLCGSRRGGAPVNTDYEYQRWTHPAVRRVGDPEKVGPESPSVGGGRSIAWVRPSELATTVAAPAFRRGADLQSEVLRRRRRTPIAASRSGRRVARSAIGRTAPAAPSTEGLGL